MVILDWEWFSPLLPPGLSYRPMPGESVYLLAIKRKTVYTIKLCIYLRNDKNIVAHRLIISTRKAPEKYTPSHYEQWWCNYSGISLSTFLCLNFLQKRNCSELKNHQSYIFKISYIVSGINYNLDTNLYYITLEIMELIILTDNDNNELTHGFHQYTRQFITSTNNLHYTNCS